MSSLKQSYDKIADPRKFPIQRPFTLDGTLTGNNNMDVNGSVTPVEFCTLGLIRLVFKPTF